MRRRDTKVEIVGGLGNQLFGFTAGLFLAEKTKSKLVLDLSLVGIGGPDHGRSLENFQIPKMVFRKSNHYSKIRVRSLARLSNKISRHSSLFRLFRKVVLQEYTASELGFENNFWSLNSPKKLKGYFQTHIYADQVTELLHEYLRISAPTPWFKDMKDKASNSNPIVIHIRRGDYMNSLSDFGVLDIQYYLRALEVFDKDEFDSPIWIFTDSPKMVKLEINNSSLSGALIIEPPIGSPPNESLILMSLCNKIIISNSTFSWWGAFLSSSDAIVVAPKKWFKGRNDPQHLIPKKWHQVDSLWKDC
jgi:hypothetical protein